ncbi:MAG: hypothetical protein ISR52_06535 [Rhodospirillales bacterium]|nr:hypothetical protein [Rhodospirillales bacterium]
MPPKKNPLKLNKLQLRTLVLAQVIAEDPGLVRRDEATGEVTLLSLPHAHGNHVHVGGFTVSAREASGFSNPAVWTALERKGLARADDSLTVTLTAAGLAYDTGLGHHFLEPSDH